MNLFYQFSILVGKKHVYISCKSAPLLLRMIHKQIISSLQTPLDEHIFMQSIIPIDP